MIACQGAQGLVLSEYNHLECSKPLLRGSHSRRKKLDAAEWYKLGCLGVQTLCMVVGMVYIIITHREKKENK